jgi:hypothetical protein
MVSLRPPTAMSKPSPPSTARENNPLPTLSPIQNATKKATPRKKENAGRNQLGKRLVVRVEHLLDRLVEVAR